MSSIQRACLIASYNRKFNDSCSTLTDSYKNGNNNLRSGAIEKTNYCKKELCSKHLYKTTDSLNESEQLVFNNSNQKMHGVVNLDDEFLISNVPICSTSGTKNSLKSYDISSETFSSNICCSSYTNHIHGANTNANTAVINTRSWDKSVDSDCVVEKGSRIRTDPISQFSVASDSTASSPDALVKSKLSHSICQSYEIKNSAHIKLPTLKREQYSLSIEPSKFLDVEATKQFVVNNDLREFEDRLAGRLLPVCNQNTVSGIIQMSKATSSELCDNKYSDSGNNIKLGKEELERNDNGSLGDLLHLDSTSESYGTLNAVSNCEWKESNLYSRNLQSKPSSTPRNEAQLNCYTFQSPSSGTVLNRTRIIENIDAAETLKNLLNGFNGCSSFVSNECSSTNVDASKARSTKKLYSVTFSHLTSCQSPVPSVYSEDTIEENKHFTSAQKTFTDGDFLSKKNAHSPLDSFPLILEELNFSCNGAATAPAAMITDSETILSSLLDSLNVETIPNEIFSKSQNSSEFQNDPSLKSDVVEKSVVHQNKKDTVWNIWSNNVECMDNSNNTNGVMLCAVSPYSHKNVSGTYSSHSHDSTYVNPHSTFIENYGDISNAPFLQQFYNSMTTFNKQAEYESLPCLKSGIYDCSSLTIPQPLRGLQPYSNNFFPSSTIDTTAMYLQKNSKLLDRKIPEFEQYKFYPDDRDRMVYVSWIPKRARAYNVADKRTMELELKHRLKENLNFFGLTKVLLFPPKGVHCKLIFNCRRSASIFMEVYGGDNKSPQTEKWKTDLCQVYGINMRDKFDKTVVKIEWSQK